MGNRTLYVFKKQAFDHESRGLFFDLRENLGISGIQEVKCANRYDMDGLNQETFDKAASLILSEVQVDEVYTSIPASALEGRCFAYRYLPAQFDQRADSAIACIKLLASDSNPAVVSSKVIFLRGNISDSDFERIKAYCINPVDSCEMDVHAPAAFGMSEGDPQMPQVLDEFNALDQAGIEAFVQDMGLAMTAEDLAFCQAYFRDTEGRCPTLTEIRVIDTYWSDHCRHTTFATRLNNIKIVDGPLSGKIKAAYDKYRSCRREVYGEKEPSRDQCLMDLATIGMKYLRGQGLLPDLDVSDEINACGIHIDVDIDGETEPWILMFKNETHNHPTEIEPFGGAATCIGGAIRDPLSGRSFVFGAMRVTGSGDPRQRVEETLEGKLPQRKITTGAMKGYSSYGNQIGLATGKVKEFYHPGFVAKRMECGAVLGGVPTAQVRRETPVAGDVVVLLGGRTGKDGIGGATGSSKDHNEKSLETGGSEVQKGNAVTERKIQRFMRNPKVARLIKRCNDFGAGGVAVAIGELADGLDINLDAVPLKYKGLDATEITISESQERMAMVIEAQDLDEFLVLAHGENMEAAKVADVTGTGRMRIYYKGVAAVDLARSFLDTNGVTQNADAVILPPEKENYFYIEDSEASLEEMFLTTMTGLNNCSQRGMTEQFDGTIGAGSVLHPLGGKYQGTESDALVMKMPVLRGETDTVAMMSYGYNPYLMSYSPYLGAQYAVVESIARLVACGADYRRARLSFQEYFERLGQDPRRWGKPLGALLGALEAQTALDCAAIGGKDSMSGSFNDLDVPPTLISFAVAPGTADCTVSQEIKPQKGGKLYLIEHRIHEDGTPDYEGLRRNFAFIHRLVGKGKAHAVMSVGAGGLVKALANMCYGNRCGVHLSGYLDKALLQKELYGSFVVQVTEMGSFLGLPAIELGDVVEDFAVTLRDAWVDLHKVQAADYATLEGIFPTQIKEKAPRPPIKDTVFVRTSYSKSAAVISGKPKVLLPAFPGTNCEYDMARRFEMAGADAEIFVFKNTFPGDIEASLLAMERKIKESQMLALSGGFSLGDEPDGSAKFITAVFRNERIKAAVEEFLHTQDGLMLGICNGFQALIKLGLCPYGEMLEPTADSPTLTFNTLGRHTARYVHTKVASNLSPWLSRSLTGGVYTVPVSHGEGRVVMGQEDYDRLIENGQIATVYTDADGTPSYDLEHNPNGSYYAIEGITSPDGRIYGKMAHSERIGRHIGKNIPGEHDQKLFEAGVDYFR